MAEFSFLAAPLKVAQNCQLIFQLFHFVPLKVFKAFQFNCCRENLQKMIFMKVKKELVVSFALASAMLVVALVLFANVAFADDLFDDDVLQSVPIQTQAGAQIIVSDDFGGDDWVDGSEKYLDDSGPENEFEKDSFGLLVEAEKTLAIGGQQLKVSLVALAKEQVSVLVQLNDGRKDAFFLRVGEKAKVGGFVLKLKSVSGDSAEFGAETEFFDSGAKAQNSVLISNSTQEKSFNAPIQIGGGSVKVSVFPVKTKEFLNEEMTETFEVPKEFESTAQSGQKINSISIKPFFSRMVAEIQTSEGTVLQEIPIEVKPVVNYKDVLISQDLFEKKIILSQQNATVTTGSEIEISDELFIKGNNFKQKITVLPMQAEKIFEERAKILSPEIVLGIEENKAVYFASKKTFGKLLGLIPVEFEVKANVDAQSGEVKISKPFWSALVVE